MSAGGYLDALGETRCTLLSIAIDPRFAWNVKFEPSFGKLLNTPHVPAASCQAG